MRRIKIGTVLLGGCLLAALLAAPAAAQEEPGNIAMIVMFGAKPGMEKQLEAGLKKHWEWHQQQNDSWSWYLWQVISGEETGRYGAGTFGHHWKDFDAPAVDEEADEADAVANLWPYVDDAIVQYHAYLPEVSREGAAPAKYSEIISFRVHYGKSKDFHDAIKKFHEAIEKTEWPVHYGWYSLVNGGEGPLYTLVLPHENWASFAPPEKPFAKMLEEAFGPEGAETLLDLFSASVKSEQSEIIAHRADLSYIPEGPEGE